ncbi:MAG: nucleotide exchange factor GrpE [Candidatus Omnitrophica bacterium]|nr:nucleotide exchange factor GrpE [Candidatus Omnitrophota bacterium]
MNDGKAKNNKNNKEELAKEEKKEELCFPVGSGKEKKEDYDALWGKYTRICADFANARKRWDREKEDLIKFSTSSLIRDLLIVLDESEQALKMVKEHGNIEEIIKGLEMAYNNFVNLLKKRGLTPIESIGRFFDPHLHEIVATKEVDDSTDKPMVLEEIQKGYMLEDKVLRPSRVIVGIKKQSTENRGQSTDNREQKTEEEEQSPEDKKN